MSLPLAGVRVLAVQQAVTESGLAAEDLERVNVCMSGGRGVAAVVEAV
jgi:hypothetical protein